MSQIIASVSAVFRFVFNVTQQQAEKIWEYLPEQLRKEIRELCDCADLREASDPTKRMIRSWCDTSSAHQTHREHEVASAIGIPTGDARDRIGKLEEAELQALDVALFKQLDGTNNRHEIRDIWNRAVQRISDKEKKENVDKEKEATKREAEAKQAQLEKDSDAMLEQLQNGGQSDASEADESDDADDGSEAEAKQTSQDNPGKPDGAKPIETT